MSITVAFLGYKIFRKTEIEISSLIPLMSIAVAFLGYKIFRKTEIEN